MQRYFYFYQILNINHFFTIDEGVSKCIPSFFMTTRPSQNELRWPLSFHIRLKSFGFSSKKRSFQVSSFKFHHFKPFSPVRSLLRGYFCKIMRYGQQAKFNFHLFQPTEMEPLEVLVVLEVSKYGFHILWSLTAIFQTFIREQLFTFPFLDFPQTVVYLYNPFRPASVTPAS